VSGEGDSWIFWDEGWNFSEVSRVMARVISGFLEMLVPEQTKPFRSEKQGGYKKIPRIFIIQ
jgi:hypothetical protein